MAARSQDEVVDYIAAAARKETLVLYALGTMLVCLLLIVAILVAPAV
jgi:hypothetical protein